MSIAIVQDASGFQQVHKGLRTGALNARRLNMVDDTQALLRTWIENILREKGWKKTHLAKQAGVSTTAITRLFDDDYSGSMNAASIAKIARAAGYPAPSNFGGVEQHQGFSEPEATPFAGPAERQLTANQSIWTVGTPALVAMGLMPGDRFLLDQSMKPANRDIVVVQQYDHATGTAETLLRVYADGFAVTPLYLVEGTPRLWIDGSNTACMGVVLESWRTRNS